VESREPNQSHSIARGGDGGSALHNEHAQVEPINGQGVKHRQAAEAETDGATDEKQAECAAAHPLARGVRPRPKKCRGEQQAQEVTVVPP